MPKPVHLDFPAEVAGARFADASELEYYYDKTQYRTEAKPYPEPRAIRRGRPAAAGRRAADHRLEQRGLLP